MADSGQPTTGEALPPLDPRLVALAGDALHARMRDDIPATRRAMEDLYGQFGSDGVKTAMLSWTDTLIHHAYPAAERGKPVSVTFEAVGTGRRAHNAEDITYGPRFAARWILARHNDDQAMAEMLLDTAIKDDRDAECVGALLDVCAMTLRAALAGRQMVLPAQGAGS